MVTRDTAPGAASEQPAPAILAVPSLGIEARVDPVGVRNDGQMAIPDDVDRVGWYRFGPVPGSDGSAVLAGHVDDRARSRVGRVSTGAVPTLGETPGRTTPISGAGSRPVTSRHWPSGVSVARGVLER